MPSSSPGVRSRKPGRQTVGGARVPELEALFDEALAGLGAEPTMTRVDLLLAAAQDHLDVGNSSAESDRLREEALLTAEALGDRHRLCRAYENALALLWNAPLTEREDLLLKVRACAVGLDAGMAEFHSALQRWNAEIRKALTLILDLGDPAKRTAPGSV